MVRVCRGVKGGGLAKIFYLINERPACDDDNY